MWHTLITTLRAQYERIVGIDDAAELMIFESGGVLHRWPQQMEWIYNGSMSTQMVVPPSHELNEGRERDGMWDSKCRLWLETCESVR